MIQRIRMSDVENHLVQLNEVMDRPASAWGDDGANIGNYHLYFAYGDYSLRVICSKAGVVHNIYTGTLREVDTYIRGMIHSIGIFVMEGKVTA